MSDQEGVTMTWEDDVPVQPLNIKTEINVELLLKIKEHVLANPEHVRMEAWLKDERWIEEDKREDDGADIYVFFGEIASWAGKPEQFAQDCGSTACIAGWAIVLSPVKEEEVEAWRCSSIAIESVAIGLLGLGAWQSDRLFYVDSWPSKFEFRYRWATTPQERAQAVADRIDHFIATNGEE